MHTDIANDEDLKTSTRMKHKAKAQKNLEKLAGKLDLPDFAEIGDNTDIEYDLHLSNYNNSNQRRLP